MKKLDKKSIIMMTRLAIYDKHQGEADRKITDHFRHDYIYRKNILSRLGAFIGGTLVIILIGLNKIYTGEMNVFELDYNDLVVSVVVFFAVLFLIVTLISSVVAAMEYNKAQTRINKYYELLRRLDISRERNKRQQQKLEKSLPSDRKEENAYLYYDFTSSPRDSY